MDTKEVAEWLREAEGYIRRAGEDYSQFLHWHTTADEFAKMADKLLSITAQVEAMTCDADATIKGLLDDLEGAVKLIYYICGEMGCPIPLGSIEQYERKISDVKSKKPQDGRGGDE